MEQVMSDTPPPTDCTNLQIYQQKYHKQTIIIIIQHYTIIGVTTSKETLLLGFPLPGPQHLALLANRCPTFPPQCLLIRLWPPCCELGNYNALNSAHYTCIQRSSSVLAHYTMPKKYCMARLTANCPASLSEENRDIMSSILFRVLNVKLLGPAICWGWGQFGCWGGYG